MEPPAATTVQWKVGDTCQSVFEGEASVLCLRSKRRGACVYFLSYEIVSWHIRSFFVHMCLRFGKTDGNWYECKIIGMGDQPDVYMIEYAGSGIQEYVYGPNLQSLDSVTFPTNQYLLFILLSTFCFMISRSVIARRSISSDPCRCKLTLWFGTESWITPSNENGCYTSWRRN